MVKSWLLLWAEYEIRTRLIKVKEDQKPQDKKLFGTLKIMWGQIFQK